MIEMGAPEIYSVVEYLAEIPSAIAVDRLMPIARTGTVNALRFITKNVVGIFVTEGRSADWHMPYMSLPLPRPVTVEAGDQLKVSFQYETGGSIESLMGSLNGTLAPRL